MYRLINPSSRWLLLFCLSCVASLASATQADSPATSLCANPGSGQLLAAQAEGVVNYWWGASESVEKEQRSLASGQRWIPVSGGRGVGTLEKGDLLLLVQIQDVRIVPDNNRGYRVEQWNAGHFEFLKAESAVVGGRIQVRGSGESGGLRHTYAWREPNNVSAAGRARWQLVRVPQYDQLTLEHDLGVLPWDGENGGILALDVRRKLDLNGFSLDVSASGFRGGAGLALNGALGAADDDSYRAPTSREAAVAYGHHASKGEGVAGTPRWVHATNSGAENTPAVLDTRPQADRRNVSDGYPLGSMARAAPGNAGGGGNGLDYSHSLRSGGGGGGNGATGGTGLDAKGQPLGGVGGLSQPLDATSVLMTAGGGAGAGVSVSDENVSHGGAGGGMVFLFAGEISGAGQILADGQDGVAGNEQAAGGGGGAGGAILLLAPFGDTGQIELSAQGGAGGAGDGRGGDGADGVFWLGGGVSLPEVKSGSLPSKIYTRLRAANLSGVLPGYLCAPGGTLLSGRLFEDNGADADQALDGEDGDQEPGLAGWMLRAIRMNPDKGENEILAQSETNDAGLFALELPEMNPNPSGKNEGTIGVGQRVRIEVAPPASEATMWRPVSRRQGEPLLPDLQWQAEGFSFVPRAETHHANIRLGWVKLPVLKVPDTRAVSSGSTDFFLFRYLAAADGEVRFHYQARQQEDSHWQHTFFLDPDCDQASEFVDTNVTRWLPVEFGQSVCVRVRVEIGASEAVHSRLLMRVDAETRLTPPAASSSSIASASSEEKKQLSEKGRTEMDVDPSLIPGAPVYFTTSGETTASVEQ